MKTVYHAANTRGNANHGWLRSRHTFSFANYYDPNRMGFGALRVINDDYVIGGQGFGQHPHQNMEIISIPLSGGLAHGDSMGHEGIIKSGDIQVMSAGTGIIHSEMNASDTEPVQFLQIWVQPNSKNVTPRYQQVSLQKLLKANQFCQVLSPNSEDDGVWIYQDAWFSIGQFDKNTQATYSLHNDNNGVYLFVIDGSVTLNDQSLQSRDGMGVWETDTITMDIAADTEVLLMEVPL